jgi:hypothetical protein
MDREKLTFFKSISKTHTHWRHVGFHPNPQRWMWEDNFGEIPEKMDVVSKCEDDECIRPDHLTLVVNPLFLSPPEVLRVVYQFFLRVIGLGGLVRGNKESKS